MCKKLGVDTYKVMGAVGKYFRISPRFLDSEQALEGFAFQKT